MSLTIEGLEEITSFVSIQGNIGSGKTTLINAIKRYITKNELSIFEPPAAALLNSEEPLDLFVIVDEPVATWSQPSCSLLNCYGKGESLERQSYLGLFYKGIKEQNDGVCNTNRYAFGFQVNAFTTRMQYISEQIRSIRDTARRLGGNVRVHLISERSPRTDRLFFKNVYETGGVAHYEWENYQQFHKTICGAILNKEDAMIHVNTDARKCFSRIYARNRLDEVSNEIPLEYLKQLDEQHTTMIEEFITQKESRSSVIEVDFNTDMTEQEIDTIAANLVLHVKRLH